MSASIRFIMRLPNTASASPLTSGPNSRGSSSGAYWPSPCTIATKSNSCLIAHV
ncbi:MAG: hypothetical protein QM723_15400 [Myxococcaceae bacterium]